MRQTVAAMVSACLMAGAASCVFGAEPPFPLMQAVPLPGDAVSFQRDGVEVAGLRFNASQRRPFVFPIVGPSGRYLTRMGHPHDPEGHRHHNSLWISHNDVNGISFWADGGAGRIVHRQVLRLEDGEEAALVSKNAWENADGKVVIDEQRRVAVRGLPGGESLLTVDIEFRAAHGEVTFGPTAFGLIGVRMAKTIGVRDGGGTIKNSGGGINEAGTFRLPARWVDYSGPVKADCVEGIALMDHPSNPGHPTAFHTRDDGWMGACLSKDAPVSIASGGTLRLRYALYAHAGPCDAAKIETQWRAFAESALPSLGKE